MPFMPAVRLNQRSEVLPAVSFSEGLFRFFSFLFSPCAAVQFLASSTFAVRTRVSVVLGLSFYPLEQAPNTMIYAMSKSGTATSGLI